MQLLIQIYSDALVKSVNIGTAGSLSHKDFLFGFINQDSVAFTHLPTAIYIRSEQT